MGGTPLRGDGVRLEDLATSVDLGPQQNAHLPLGCAYSFESVALPGHFVRHRGVDVWADQKVAGADVTAAEVFAFDASFTAESGLLGYGVSFRSTNSPLEYVRQRDGRLVTSEYDGSAGLRADATFEPRVFSEAPECARDSDVELGVCLMLAALPGRYARTDKDGRVVVDKYHHPSAVAFRFRVVSGLALSFDGSLGAPLVVEVKEDGMPPWLAGKRQLAPAAAEPAAGPQPEPPKPASGSTGPPPLGGGLPPEALRPCFALPPRGDQSIEASAREALRRAAEGAEVAASRAAAGRAVGGGTFGASPVVRRPASFEVVD